MTTRSSLAPILIAGSAVLLIGFGIRASYGVFQIPVAEQFGWGRAEFSMAIAIQNLFWGIGQPIFGALAEKFGDRRALALGALTYAAGLVLTSMATTPLAHQALSVLVGFGIAGTGFGVILAVIGRAASAEQRSLALGIATAAGSAGQVVGPTLAAVLLNHMSWSGVFLVFAAAILSVLALLPLLRAPATAGKAELEETLGQVLLFAFRDPSYIMITVGFFACGYQVAFITAHFPALVAEASLAPAPDGLLAGIGIATPAALGAAAFALVGLTNIVGTVIAGWAGRYRSKKRLLAGIYLARAVLFALFISLPMTPATVLTFAAGLGLLWLATIPLTSGLVAHLYGLRYMGTLYGFVFLSHQLGSFTGVWLGGRLYDLTGSYSSVWWLGVAIALIAAALHLPVKEEDRRPRPAMTV